MSQLFQNQGCKQVFITQKRLRQIPNRMMSFWMQQLQHRFKASVILRAVRDSILQFGFPALEEMRHRPA